MSDFVLQKRAEERQGVMSKILQSKIEKNWSWEKIGDQMGVSPLWLISACFGLNAFDNREQVKMLEQILWISLEEHYDLLCSPPLKGQFDAQKLLQDPLIYRLQEMVLGYGLPIKELIEEKFGIGIMSAIDFKCDLEKFQDDKGQDRVRIILDGKYLPYKTSW